jgi:hypothetical protein
MARTGTDEAQADREEGSQASTTSRVNIGCLYRLGYSRVSMPHPYCFADLGESAYLSDEHSRSSIDTSDVSGIARSGGPHLSGSSVSRRPR